MIKIFLMIFVFLVPIFYLVSSSKDEMKLMHYENGDVGLVYPNGLVHRFHVEHERTDLDKYFSKEELEILEKYYKNHILIPILQKEWDEYLKNQI